MHLLWVEHLQTSEYCTYLILMTGYVQLTRGAFLMKSFLRNAHFSRLFFYFFLNLYLFSRDLKNKANIDEIVHCGNNNITKQKKTDWLIILVAINMRWREWILDYTTTALTPLPNCFPCPRKQYRVSPFVRFQAFLLIRSYIWPASLS